MKSIPAPTKIQNSRDAIASSFTGAGIFFQFKINRIIAGTANAIR